jgi:hypothetical protein
LGVAGVRLLHQHWIESGGRMMKGDREVHVEWHKKMGEYCKGCVQEKEYMYHAL